MKKAIIAIESLANRWFKHQYKTPIDSEYISKNIIYQYAYLEYLKDEKVPFFSFASLAYHYFKLGKISKVEELYINFINNEQPSKPKDTNKNIIIKKSPNPKGFEKVYDISKEKKEQKTELNRKFNPNDAEFKKLKEYFVFSTSIDKLITNNKDREQKEEYRSYLIECKKSLTEELKKEIVFENIQKNIELIGNNEKDNTFNKKANLTDMIKFFSVFKSPNEKNDDKQWLDENQFNKFIEKAFKGNIMVEKQKIELGNSEKFFIVKRFAAFYESHLIQNLAKKSDKERYIKLLTDNFTDWYFEDIKANFKTTNHQRSWDLY